MNESFTKVRVGCPSYLRQHASLNFKLQHKVPYVSGLACIKDSLSPGEYLLIYTHFHLQTLM